MYFTVIKTLVALALIVLVIRLVYKWGTSDGKKFTKKRKRK